MACHVHIITKSGHRFIGVRPQAVPTGRFAAVTLRASVHRRVDVHAHTYMRMRAYVYIYMYMYICIYASIVKFSHPWSTVRDLINTISLTFVATYRACRALSLVKMSLADQAGRSYWRINDTRFSSLVAPLVNARYRRVSSVRKESSRLREDIVSAFCSFWHLPSVCHQTVTFCVIYLSKAFFTRRAQRQNFRSVAGIFNDIIFVWTE